MSKIEMELVQKGSGNQVNLRIMGLSVDQIYPMFLAHIEALKNEHISDEVILGSLFAAVVVSFSPEEISKFMEVGEKKHGIKKGHHRKFPQYYTCGI